MSVELALVHIPPTERTSSNGLRRRDEPHDKETGGRAPGKKVGHYMISRTIGEGTFGKVMPPGIVCRPPLALDLPNIFTKHLPSLTRYWLFLSTSPLPDPNFEFPADCSSQVKLGTHILTGETVAIKVLEKERIVDLADVHNCWLVVPAD